MIDKGTVIAISLDYRTYSRLESYPGSSDQAPTEDHYLKCLT